ncbi:MAG: ATP cone domain-containing protein [Candidatus Aenigmatarchaeota archaeon]
MPKEKMIYVTKASGEKAEFNPEKIRKTCLKAGATKKLADEVTKEITKKAYSGIKTKKILQMTIRLLEKKMPHVAAKYDLKGAIMRLGPAGFAFENLVAEILSEYGHKTFPHSILEGGCVEHEVDIIAEKKERCAMIECKYHNLPGIYTGIKDALYTYARFLDLQEGAKMGRCRNFTDAWLICNTKFSTDAIRYAACKHMRLIGWSWPRGAGSLQKMLDAKKMYPITILRKLDKDSQKKLSKARMMLCKDLLAMDIDDLRKLTGISKRKLIELRKEAQNIIKK